MAHSHVKADQQDDNKIFPDLKYLVYLPETRILDGWKHIDIFRNIMVIAVTSHLTRHTAFSVETYHGQHVATSVLCNVNQPAPSDIGSLVF